MRRGLPESVAGFRLQEVRSAALPSPGAPQASLGGSITKREGDEVVCRSEADGLGRNTQSSGALKFCAVWRSRSA